MQRKVTSIIMIMHTNMCETTMISDLEFGTGLVLRKAHNGFYFGDNKITKQTFTMFVRFL